jgi:chemotaxis signal transduction protein
MKLCLMNLDDAEAGDAPQPAVPAAEVLEFSTDTAVTPVPLTPPLLAGIANLHGEIVPVIRGATLMGMEGSTREPATGETPFLVVSTALGPVGIQVRSVDLVTLADPENSDQPPGFSAASQEKSSPDEENLSQLSAESVQEALFSEEPQALDFTVLEEQQDAGDAGEQEPGESASDNADSQQPATGLQGIFSRTLQIDGRGVYRQLQVNVFSRRLKELLGSLEEQV